MDAHPVITLSGALSTTSGSSPVTSATRTATVIRGPGTIVFSSILTDSGTPQYSKNGGAFSNITEGLEVAMANTDTLAVRATLPTAGMQASFTVSNKDTLAVIENVTLGKS